MGVEDWSTDEALNLELDGADISRRASPGAPANELTRKLMAHVKELEEKIVSDGIAVDGITIENNSGTLTVKDVAIDGDTTDLLTAKIEEIEAAATQAGEDATAAQTAATQAAASAASVETSVTAAATAANVAAEQADIAARAAARAQSGAAMAESAVQAVISGTNLNWQKTEKAASVSCYPVPETVFEPAVDYLFVETGPESGTKGPDNPSTITGVSTITVTRCETAGVDSTDYTIDLNGTYYGGSIDLATGVMTVTHKKETISSVGRFSVADTCVGARVVLNDRYLFSSQSETTGLTVETLTNNLLYDPSGSATFEHFRNFNSLETNTIVIYISKDRLDFSSAIDPESPTESEMIYALRSWAGTNNISFYGKLATPYTIQLSPIQILSLIQTDKYTPRLNTVYTDASAVQVGYVKSPIRSEYEMTQAIIATEGGE